MSRQHSGGRQEAAQRDNQVSAALIGSRSAYSTDSPPSLPGAPKEDHKKQTRVTLTPALTRLVKPRSAAGRRWSPYIAVRLELWHSSGVVSSKENRSHVLIRYGSQRRRPGADRRSRSPRCRSAHPGGDGDVVESWPARLVGERTAGMVGASARCRWSSAGSGPMIFALQAAHSHDLSLTLVARGRLWLTSSVST